MAVYIWRRRMRCSGRIYCVEEWFGQDISKPHWVSIASGLTREQAFELVKCAKGIIEVNDE